MSGPTHCQNHTLDLILSHGIDVNGVEVLQQSDDISVRREMGSRTQMQRKSGF